MTQVSSGNGLAIIGHPQTTPPPPPPPQCEIHQSAHSMQSPALRHQQQQQQNKPLLEHQQQQGELIWGEILERSLSSGSLHHLQRLQCNHDDVGNSNKRHHHHHYQQQQSNNGGNRH